MRRAVVLALGAVGAGGACWAPSVAFAQAEQGSPAGPPIAAPSIAVRPATYGWDKASLRVSFGYRDVIDAEILGRLRSGIPVVIVMRAWLFEAGRSTPVADQLTAKSCRVVYDLWDEVFRVEVTQPGGSASTVAANVQGVLRRCAEVERVPVIERSALRVGGVYVLQGLVEVNPISADIMDRIKRWVSRPKGGSTVGAGDALFGSFVGLFVADIGAADRLVRFKTPAFVVPPAAAPGAPSGVPAPSAAPPATAPAAPRAPVGKPQG